MILIPLRSFFNICSCIHCVQNPIKSIPLIQYDEYIGCMKHGFWFRIFRQRKTHISILTAIFIISWWTYRKTDFNNLRLKQPSTERNIACPVDGIDSHGFSLTRKYVEICPDCITAGFRYHPRSMKTMKTEQCARYLATRFSVSHKHCFYQF